MYVEMTVRNSILLFRAPYIGTAYSDHNNTTPISCIEASLDNFLLGAHLNQQCIKKLSYSTSKSKYPNTIEPLLKRCPHTTNKPSNLNLDIHNLRNLKPMAIKHFHDLHFPYGKALVRWYLDRSHSHVCTVITIILTMMSLKSPMRIRAKIASCLQIFLKRAAPKPRSLGKTLPHMHCSDTKLENSLQVAWNRRTQDGEWKVPMLDIKGTDICRLFSCSALVCGNRERERHLDR